MNEINFPNKIITKYILFESNRWDLETVNKKIIKLPNKNYTKSLENYLKLIKNKISINMKYLTIELPGQLILK